VPVLFQFRCPECGATETIRYSVEIPLGLDLGVWCIQCRAEKQALYQ
jgi:hypothetical protein